jgi:hypothetical protein
MTNDDVQMMRLTLKAAQDMAEMVQSLVVIRNDHELDDRDREWSALSAVLRWMETLPHTGTDPTLLQPLRALCARLAPNLGSGRSDISKYTMQSAALGVVDILMKEGRGVGEARKIVAAKMSKCGVPTKARTIASWTEGTNVEQWREVRAGTGRMLQASCPPEQDVEDHALRWLEDIYLGYVRQET